MISIDASCFKYKQSEYFVKKCTSTLNKPGSSFSFITAGKEAILGLVQVPVKIGGRQKLLTIDTGATGNTVAEDLVKRLKPMTYGIQPHQVRTSTGTTQITTQTGIPIQLQEVQFNIHALVVPKQPVDLLVETEFLRAHKGIVNLHRNRLAVSGASKIDDVWKP